MRYIILDLSQTLNLYEDLKKLKEFVFSHGLTKNTLEQILNILDSKTPHVFNTVDYEFDHCVSTGRECLFVFKKL